MNRSVLLAFLCVSATAALPAQSPRVRAAYALPDGSIQVISSATLASLTKALDDAFLASHPGSAFTLRAGDNYSAMAALTFDRTPFAPMGCQYTRIGLGDNLKIAAEPLGLRIAHASLKPGPVVPALGIIVNPANPIASLSSEQLIRIFAAGASAGAIVTWSQAAVQGVLAEREIHPIGPYTSDYRDSEDPQAGEFLSTTLMQGLNMNHTYEPLARYSAVVDRVREDPAAIGISALNISLAGVRVLPIKRSDSTSPIAPSAKEIAAGRYPYDRYVYLYLRRGKGQPLDPFAVEYARFVLSAEGQHVVAGELSGYIPLNSGETAEELAKLDR
jgi:phosphate transport system substrate-binding protein